MSDHNNKHREHSNTTNMDIDLEGIFPFEINHNTKNAFSGYKSLYFPHRTDVNIDSSQYRQFEQDYEFIVENETKLIEHIKQYKKALQSAPNNHSSFYAQSSTQAPTETSDFSNVPIVPFSKKSSPKPPLSASCASPNPSVVTTASSSTISNLSSPLSVNSVTGQYTNYEVINKQMQNKQYLDYQRSVNAYQQQQQQKYYNAALMQQYAANYNAYYGQNGQTQQYNHQYANSSYPTNYFQVL